MSVRGGPLLYTPSLVGNYDAGTPDSLVSGSSTWFDTCSTQNGAITAAGTTYAAVYGGALSGNGTVNTNVTVSNNAFGMGTGSFTYNMWARPSASTTMVMLEARTPGGTAGGTLWAILAAGNQVVHLNDPNNAVYTQPSSPATLGGQTVNLCVTVNRATSLVSFYQNGQLYGAVSCASTTGNVSPSPATQRIFYDAGGLQFNGLIYTFSFYSGIALSQQQVRQNYDALRGRFGQ